LLQNYARLLVRTGLNVQQGQEVLISAQLDQPRFVEMVVAECYAAGAAVADVEWSHQPLTKLDVAGRSPEVLGRVEEWKQAKYRHMTEKLTATLGLLSQDPDGLAGIDQAKYAAARQKTLQVIKPIMEPAENRYQWCVAAVPGKAWARKLFPGLPDDEAVEALWKLILFTSRADGEDPEQDWKVHNENLIRKSGWLNSLNLTSLRYRASNGTDFTVGLIPGARFLAGGDTTVGSGVFFNPNMPTEEAFTAPKRGVAEGLVVASKPLSWSGVLIEDFSVRFHEGKAVEVKAAKNQQTLEKIITMDENAAYLGECALVPYDSPISKSGVLFYNTLFDENASCHLALGKAYTACLPGFETLTKQEMIDMGANDSLIHVDFMIGTSDLSITGLTADGTEVPVFTNGNWA